MMKTLSIRAAVSLCAPLLLTFTSPHVVAQTTNEAGARQLEEIVVRAQKKSRAEDLQEVPASITAFNELQLDRIIYQDLSDLSYSIPNVQLEEIGTFPGVQNFSIRGQGINSSIPSIDPTVGTFIDGVYVGTTYGVVVDNWDLESIEVLRGPQGLLFGRNVSGGAVLMRNIRPDPQGEFEAKARVMATNEDREVYSVAAGGPLIQDKLAGRVMLYYENDDGYFENKNTAPNFKEINPAFFYVNQQPGNRDLNEMETKIARPSLVWTPSDELEFTLLAEFGDIEGDGAPWTVIDGIDGVIPGQREGTGPDGKKLDEFTTTIDEYGDTDIDWKNATFETNWEIFGGTLTNIFGYREVDVDATSDIDGTGVPIFTATGETDQDQTSNELRFATRLFDRWDMTVGAYYLTQDVSYEESRYIQVLLPPTIPPTPAPPGFGATLLAVGGEFDSDYYGIFFNNDFELTDEIVLTAGLRYSDEDKDAEIISESCNDVQNFNCPTEKLDGDWDNWIPKLGVQWNFAENAQTYAFFTQGYRSGGFNFRNARPGDPTLPFPAPVIPGSGYGLPPGPTQQEEQDNYEVGLKIDLFDQRLRVNASYFYNKIDNLQGEINTGDVTVVVLQGTVNTGDATIKGVELETTALLTDYLTLFGSVGYLDGEYDDKKAPWDGLNQGNLTGGVPDPIPWLGNDLPRLAPWSYSVGASYEVPLETYGSLAARTDFNVRDSNAYDIANTAYFDRQKRWNASLSWISPNENWTVTAFGKNMLDESNYGNITSIANAYNAGPMQRGEEYGLQIEFRL